MAISTSWRMRCWRAALLKGILVNSNLNMSQQHAQAGRKANHILGCIEHDIASQAREGTVLPYTALVWPHLVYRLQVWVPHYKKNMKLLESIQRRATKMGEHLEGKIYDKGLKSLGLFSPEQSRLRGGLMVACSFSQGAEGVALNSARWCGLYDSDGTWWNSIELCQGRVRWGLGRGSSPHGSAQVP